MIWENETVECDGRWRQKKEIKQDVKGECDRRMRLKNQINKFHERM